jgi:HAD superfamily hydrolase (TIGR01509 family)
MDGTLVDTEPAWNAAQHQLVGAHGGSWSDEHAANLVGNSLLETGEYIKVHGNVPLTAAEIVDALVEELIAHLKREISWRPGALDLLADLRRHGVPCALVTMSYRRMADVVVSALPPETFAATVVGDEIANGKPHPEPYLTAARQLGVAPAECVVIEDSNTGARSGLAAGARVVAVPNIVPIDVPGVTLVPSLAGLDADWLAVEAELRRNGTA